MSEVAIKVSEYFRFKRSPSEGECPVVGCRNKTAKSKRLCHRHHQQLWRARNPTRCAYAILKSHAKRRKVEFSLSFEEFSAVVAGTRYIKDRGRENGCMHIDRVDASKGYVPGNCRVIEASENIAKGNRERRNLQYRIALFERIGDHAKATELRAELRWLEDGWFCEPDIAASSHKVTDTEPF